MQLFFHFIHFSICVFEVYIFFNFISTFFEKKAYFKMLSFHIVLLVSCFIYTVNLANNSIVNILAVPLIYVTMTIVVFNGNLLAELLYSLFAFIIFIGCEFCLIVILKISPVNEIDYTAQTNYRVLILMIVMKLFTFIVFMIIKRIPKSKEKSISLKSFMTIMVIPISTITMLISLYYIGINYAALSGPDEMLLFSCIALMMGNGLVFSIFDKLVDTMSKANHLEMINLKYNMESQHHEQIDKINNEYKKILHDSNHYLKAIGILAAEADNTKILNILSELELEFENISTKLYCNYYLLNAILCEREKQAEKANVNYDVYIEPIFQINFVSELDLISILSNLLDNSIEAASQCKNGVIKINMFMANENAFSVIEIKNNYSVKPIRKGNRLITSKLDKNKHGIGIGSVEKTVKKYNGYMKITEENNEFKVTLILSSPM